MLLFPLIFACSSPPPAPPPDALRRPGSGAPIRLLDRVEAARIELPLTSLPEGSQSLTSFPLEEWQHYEDETRYWYHPLPIHTERKRYFATPDGFRLTRRGEAMPFQNLPANAPVGSWDVVDGSLVLVSDSDPSGWSNRPVLEAPAAEARRLRLNFEHAGLSRELFVRYESTIDTITMEGLLLPAPGAIHWEMALPEGAQLELWPSLLERDLLSGEGSDGASVAILIGDEVVQRLQAETLFGAGPQRIDLSAWGGETVELTLRTEPGVNANWDYVFLGAPLIWGEPAASPRRVVMIGVDTLRYDALTQHGYARDTTTPLERLARGSVLFDRAFTPAPRTRPSFRTLLTGRWPLDAVDAPPLATSFQAAGFTTAGIVANVHLVPRFAFNEGSDYWHYQNAQDANLQVELAKRWLDTNRERDAFLFLHLIDPHVFYEAPAPFTEQYVEVQPDNIHANLNRWQLMQMQEKGKISEADRSWLRGRYDSEIRFMAEQVADLIRYLEGLPGDTLVVFTSDHGEEFWDHGGYEHNHTLYQELVHGVLWIRPPGGWAGGPHRLDAPVAWVDVGPTMLDAAGVPEALWPPDLPGRSLRPLFDSTVADQRPALESFLDARRLPIGHLMYDREQWAVFADGHKYILELSSGEERLFNLDADPDEQNDLAPAATAETLERWRSALGEATGWPAGAGWRVRLSKVQGPLTFRFEQPVDAEILDPEFEKTRRANMSWGEISAAGPDDVGRLSFSEDRTEVTFTPGPEARNGILMFLTPEGSRATISDGVEEKIAHEELERLRIGDTSFLRFNFGGVLLPKDSIRAHLPGEEADEASVEALQALGYMEE